MSALKSAEVVTARATCSAGGVLDAGNGKVQGGKGEEAFFCARGWDMGRDF